MTRECNGRSLPLAAALRTQAAALIALADVLDAAPPSSSTTYDHATCPGGPRSPRAWREWLDAHGIASTGRGGRRVALAADVDAVLAAPRARAVAPASAVDPIARALRLVGGSR